MGTVRDLELRLDSNDGCNLACIHCERRVDLKETEPMGEDVLRELARAFPRAREVWLSCGAEPLLTDRWQDALRLARLHGVPRIGMVTNATRLTRPVAETMVCEGLTDLVVSVDSLREPTLRHIRGISSRVLAHNVSLLGAVKRELGASEPRLEARLVLMRGNVEEVPSLIPELKELGFERLVLQHLVVLFADLEDQSLRHHQALSNACLRRAAEVARELRFTLLHPPLFAAEEGRPPQPPPPRARCEKPWHGAIVNHKGQVMPCITIRTPFGELGKESFAAIHGGSRFEELRAAHACGDLPEVCRRCLVPQSQNVDHEAGYRREAADSAPLLGIRGRPAAVSGR